MVVQVDCTPFKKYLFSDVCIYQPLSMNRIRYVKVTIIPIVISVLVRSPKGLEQLEVGGQVETIQTITLLRTDKILRRVLEETPMKDHQPKLMRRTLNNNSNNNNQHHRISGDERKKFRKSISNE